jgi:sphinganine-1-phosphate aldolase
VIRIESRGKVGLVSYVTKLLLRLANNIGFIRNKKEKYLEEESTKNVEETLQKKQVRVTYDRLPEKGLPKEDILAILDKRVNADINPTEGKTFAYVYEHSKAHSELTEACFVKYMHSNALNPVMFNSLRVIENEVIRMAATLFHGDENAVGNVTSCGTESLLLAMKTYRDYRGKGQVIMCTTGHPGINKGCSYVGLEVVQIPYDENKRMSLKHLKSAISSSTVVVVCSAPQYPNGVVDDVPAIAAICRKYGVPLHVDAAIGGFVLPFIEMEGKAKFKPFDFRVEGVTSINADVHKYGYAPKGSSVLIYRDSIIRRHQYFSFATWPGGIYISPTAMGTRNGGCLSAAWGSLLDLGIDGFRKITAQILIEV